MLQIYFQTDPAKRDKLSGIVVEQLNKMAKVGPTTEQMEKIKKYMLKKYNDAQKENGYWLNNLNEYFYSGVDNTKDYVQMVNDITINDVKHFLDELLKQGNEIQVVMTMPGETK
jgi:zinc protease